jgi:phosphoenolpyruvate carboxykinase (ATP)
MTLDIVTPHLDTKYSTKDLIDIALKKEGAVICDNGAIVVTTGERTGRSPNDRFIVKDDETTNTVAWGKVNKPFDSKSFSSLWKKTESYLENNCYSASLQVGADARFGFNVNVRTEKAWHNVFLRHLFISDTRLDIPADKTWTLLSAPELALDPKNDGVNSDAAVIINISEKKILIAGMRYAGEMKKSMFSALNYILPEQGVLPMHCSANVGKNKDVALFFGLSGTGKTTLSADPERALIGDDEHGWGDNGVFNFEGGCYAKCINLTKEHEPVIWDAIRYGSVIENVILDSNNTPDYTNSSLTENIRAAYPRAFLSNKVIDNNGDHPNKIFFLSCDLYGVLPPLAKLTCEQAAYYFLSGYTAKVGSTEVGSTAAVSPTFSVCFGEPFFPRPAQEYADLFMKRINETGAEVFLVNTGWTGGSYGKGGKRFSLPVTRKILNAALDNKISSYKKSTIPFFDFMIPSSIDGISDDVLDPRISRDSSDFDKDAKALADMFKSNFTRFNASDSVIAAGPRE